MQVCPRCRKWRLLDGQCTVCASLERLRSAAGSSHLPSTSEAEAKTTKILDGAYYSLARLFPESDEESGKGEASPKRKTEEKPLKGEKSPKPTAGEKKKKDQKAGKEDTERKEKEVREEVEGGEKKETQVKTVHLVEEKKALPKKKEEDKPRRSRSRTPRYQKEKDKRKDKKKDSKSRSVSGSIVRKKKREDFTSHRPACEETSGSAKPSSGIQRETYLRPRPSRREPRSPRTPDHPPPRAPPVQPGGGRGSGQGTGWRGSTPHSHHPRWSESTNKGITKRAKQELHERKQYRGRW